MEKRELVYSLLAQVPKDKVTTYSELAHAAGTHPRAVGMFMRTNKDTENIDCFRVVRSNGEIGGYSGGGGKKKMLLEKSGIHVDDDMSVDLERHMHVFKDVDGIDDV